MKLSRFEKIVYMGCPWLFGVVAIAGGGILTVTRPHELQGVILASSGLICMSLVCVCALLARLVGSRGE